MESDFNSHKLMRVAAIHDISGFGKSSLTMVLPILSTLGIQACPLPTALLSTQTSGFSDYYYQDLTDAMQAIIHHWKQLQIPFDGIYSGFLGSSRQIEVVSDFIDAAAAGSAGLPVLIDPVLGDEGVTYGPVTEELTEGMRELVKKATVITPNFTEACLLLSRPFREEISVEEIREMLGELSLLGPDEVIMTSVPAEGRRKKSAVYAASRTNSAIWKVERENLPGSYAGTGDAFASVIMGSLLNGEPVPESIERAVEFVYRTIRTTRSSGVPEREGILIERMLAALSQPVPIHTRELVN